MWFFNPKTHTPASRLLLVKLWMSITHVVSQFKCPKSSGCSRQRRFSNSLAVGSPPCGAVPCFFLYSIGSMYIMYETVVMTAAAPHTRCHMTPTRHPPAPRVDLSCVEQVDATLVRDGHELLCNLGKKKPSQTQNNSVQSFNVFIHMLRH